MSKNIQTSSQLETFLKKLIENSVESAFDTLKSSENIPQTVLEQVDEEEVEEEVEEEAEETTPEEEASDSEVEVEEESETEVEEKSDNEEKNPMLRGPRREPKRPETGAEVKITHIFYDINQIRSGRSLKDPDVKANLEDYFDRLSSPERMALSEFLEGLTDVIVKGIPAEEAEDPGEEVKMSEPGSSGRAKETEVEVKEKEPTQGEPALTPPIQVRR